MDRASRTQETRAADVVHEVSHMSWESPALLDTTHIPARPGYVQRWVRTKLRGEDDQSNVFRKINQGWKPRLLDSVPKGSYVPNVDFNGVNVIGIHGNILMERPVEIHEKHAAYNRQQAENQMIAARQTLGSVHKADSCLTAPTMQTKTDVRIGRNDPDED